MSKRVSVNEALSPKRQRPLHLMGICKECEQNPCLCLLNGPPCNFSSELVRTKRYQRKPAVEAPIGNNLAFFVYRCFPAGQVFTLPQVCSVISTFARSKAQDDAELLTNNLKKSSLRNMLDANSDVWAPVPEEKGLQPAFKCNEPSVNFQSFIFCDAHGCRGGLNCVLDADRYDLDVNICNRHVCDYYSCLQVKEPNRELCADHRCKVDACTNVCLWEKPCLTCSPEPLRTCYTCYSQVCHYNDCTNSIVAGAHVCGEHKEKCDNANVCMGRGKYDEVTKKVLCEHCMLCQKCTLDKAIAATNFRLCAECVCHRDGCQNEVRMASDYCMQCTCQVFACQQQSVVKGGNYCVLHKCTVERCDKLSTGGQFCLNHQCGVHGCTFTAMAPRGFCFQHACGIASGICIVQRKANSRFCEQHTCWHMGCPNQVKSEVSKSCWKHGCKTCGKPIDHMCVTLLCSDCSPKPAY